MQIHLFDKDQDAELFPAGRIIFRVGDPGSLMFAVLDGTVEISIHGKTVETVGPGGVFGEMALIEELPRIATALVKTDAKIVPIDRKRFMFLVQQNPFFALQLMTIMAGRLRSMDEKI
ncbi:MAG: cyclic nucleotide-binding domain-containing protein [bacterium]|nr:cyclic nucleotide-binding domain-containing protein [bacterium]MDI1335610.1 cyclic nucleotide-binding domain-containing protein [Lacunisphaera sp.]